VQLNIVDLFSGIGGFSLGLHNADKRFKTIAFAENDPFCQKVLKKNFGNTKIFNDIREVSIDQPVFLVCGGFPCQGFSVAGRQRGTDDDRYLWGEMFDIIKQTKPRWVIAENVRGIVTTQDGLAFNIVHSDLESEGYEVQAFNIPAIGKGAWHRRERIWFIANSNSRLRGRRRTIGSSGNQQDRKLPVTQEKSECETQDFRSKTLGCNVVFGKEKDLLNTDNQRLKEFNISKESNKQNFDHRRNDQVKTDETWWQTQSKLCGVPNGISYGLDKDRARRIKALGNAIVPQIIETIGKAIIKSEEDNNTL
jgi:DNA (cytosine-5)-methyltransferase 1